MNSFRQDGNNLTRPETDTTFWAKLAENIRQDGKINIWKNIQKKNLIFNIKTEKLEGPKQVTKVLQCDG